MVGTAVGADVDVVSDLSRYLLEYLEDTKDKTRNTMASKRTHLSIIVVNISETPTRAYCIIVTHTRCTATH